MKRFTSISLFSTMMLATAMVACGSSSNNTGSTSAATDTTGTSSTGSTSSTTGSTTGSTSTTGTTSTTSNGNTTSSTSTTATNANVSVSGTLGSINFTGQDAAYGISSVDGVSVVVVVVSDGPDLCNAFNGNATLGGNVLIAELVTNAGGDLTTGDYTVTDGNNTIAATAAGEAVVGVLNVADENAEDDASSGDVNVTSYSANNPIVLTISAAATGAAGVKGNVTAPFCAAVSSAFSDTSSTTSTKFAKRVQLRKLPKLTLRGL